MSFGVRLDGVPEIGWQQCIALVDIDDSGVPLGPPADARVAIAFQIDGKRQTIVDIGLARNERDFRVKPAQLRIGELRRTVTDPQLVELRTLAHQNWEGTR
jgi:hypothetical protein